MCKDFNEFCVCKDAVMVPAALEEHAAASVVHAALGHAAMVPAAQVGGAGVV